MTKNGCRKCMPEKKNVYKWRTVYIMGLKSQKSVTTVLQLYSKNGTRHCYSGFNLKWGVSIVCGLEVAVWCTVISCMCVCVCVQDRVRQRSCNEIWIWLQLATWKQALNEKAVSALCVLNWKWLDKVKGRDQAEWEREGQWKKGGNCYISFLSEGASNPSWLADLSLGFCLFLTYFVLNLFFLWPKELTGCSCHVQTCMLVVEVVIT